MKVQKNEVQAWSCGTSHIFYRHDKRLQGVFIIFLTLKKESYGYEMWKQFTSRYDDIYFSTIDPSYIRNHCEFHGYLGKSKVYKYVR